MKNKTSPPHAAQKFLCWFLNPDLQEEVLGDLEENFSSKIKEKSKFRAQLSYWFQVFSYLRPFAIRHSNSFNSLFMMHKHNLTITYRSFLKYKSSFFINIIGLSTGMACSFLIFLWISDETSVDKFHEDDHLLYQVMLNHNEDNNIRTGNATPYHLAAVLIDEFPEIDLAIRDTDSKMFENGFSLKNSGKVYKAEGKFTDSRYFELFSFRFKHGDPVTALPDNNSIVITESLAQKIFGTTENLIGKNLEWQILHLNGVAQITGILYNLPANSTESFEFVLPFSYYGESFSNQGWGNFINQTYVKLKPKVNPTDLNKKIQKLINEKAGATIAEPFVKRYSSNYLYGNFENGQVAGGRIDYVRLFGFIAIFVLMIACINFMNLSTARASRRLKEVGVKKALGAKRSMLIYQYIFEAVFLSLLSLILAFSIVVVLLPFFNDLTGKHLTIPITLEIIIKVGLVTLITGLLAGSYPAFYLSGFKPISIFKGVLKTSYNELFIRKGLVIFQFTLSVILIISVFAVKQQVDYLQNKNLGYNKENILKLSIEGEVVGSLNTFLNKIKELPEVVNASAASHALVKKSAYTTGVEWAGKKLDVEVGFERIRTNGEIIETLGVEIVEGRSFSSQLPNEFDKIIFNEKAIKAMGFADPIGQKVKLWGKEKEIIGVVKDFHYSSLHDEIEPLFLHYDTAYLESVFVKIKSENMQENIASIAAFYKSFNPGYALNYEFLDQNYAERYGMEQKISSLSQFFAVLAILISILGLFGLAAFTAERRMKEVGIRKVMGARTISLIMLLSTDFNKMTIAAIALALPLSYIMINLWLSHYAYKIDLQWYHFIMPAALVYVLSWLVVVLQTLKTTLLNPVDTLKIE